MIQTLSLQNRSYLAVTTITSVGVLSGVEYCSPLLAVLLVVAGNMTIVWARGRKGYMLVPVEPEEEEFIILVY